MKLKSLFIVALTLFVVACSDDNDPKQPQLYNIEEYTPVSFDNQFCLIDCYSPERMVACYPLHGTQYNPEEKLWDIPASDIKEEVDLGYGQTEIKTTKEYHLSRFFPNTHKVYSLYSFQKAHICLRFYNDKGEFVKESSGIYFFGNIPTVCPFDENSLMALSRGYDNTGFNYLNDTLFVFNNNFEEKRFIAPCYFYQSIYGNDGVEIKWEKVDDTHYVSNFVFITINYAESKIDTREFDIKGYLKEKYPNETNEPLYEVKNVAALKTTTSYTIEVTLYSGQKETLSFTVDNNTLEDIK